MTTTTIVLSTLLIGIIATTWQALVAATQRDRAVEAEQRAFQHFEIAVNSVDSLYDQLAQRIEDEPQLTQWQQEILESALGYYLTFTRIAAGDPKLEFRAVRAFRRVGDIHRQKGNWLEAERAYQEASDRWQQWTEQTRADYPTELAEILLARAEVISQLSDIHTAELALDSSISAWSDLRQRFPGSAGIARKHGLAFSVRGKARMQWGHYQLADDDYRLAIASLVGFQDSFDPSSVPIETQGLRQALCKLRINRAANLARLSMSEEQEQEERQALQLAEALKSELPDKVDIREMLALIRTNLAATLFARQDRVESKMLLQAAVADYERLVQDFPSRTPLRNNAATAYANLANFLRGNAATEQDSKRYHARALQERRSLAEANSGHQEYLREYASLLSESAYEHYAAGQVQQAVDLGRQGAEVLEKIISRFPDDAASQSSLVGHLANMSVFYRRLNQLEESEEIIRRALTHSDCLVAKFPENPKYRADAALTRNGLGNILSKRNLTSDALQVRREVVRMMDEIPQHQVETVLDPSMRTMFLANLAHALHAEGEYAEAIQYARNALLIDPTYGLARGLLAEILANCPDPELRKPEEALEIAQPMLEVSERDAAYGAGICGIAHYRLSQWAQALPLLQSGSLNAGDRNWETIVQFYILATLCRLNRSEDASGRYQQLADQIAGLPTISLDLQLAVAEVRMLLQEELNPIKETKATPDADNAAAEGEKE